MARKIVGRTMWDFMYDVWPSERGWVTIGIFSLLGGMLSMARTDPSLWDVEIFKVIIQAVAVTGLLNMILAFHFTANKGDEARTENTGKALDAIKATAQAGTQARVKEAADQVVQGAEDARDEVVGSQSKGGISSDEEDRT